MLLQDHYGGGGFDLWSAAGCVLTGPMFWVAVDASEYRTKWEIPSLLPVKGNGDLRRGSLHRGRGGEGRSGVGKYYVGSIGACDNSVITVNCQLSVLQPWTDSRSVNDVSYSTICRDHTSSSPGTRRRHRALHHCLGLYTALQVCWPMRLILQCDLCTHFSEK